MFIVIFLHPFSLFVSSFKDFKILTTSTTLYKDFDVTYKNPYNKVR